VFNLSFIQNQTELVFTVSVMLERGGGDASNLLLFLKIGKGGDL
jgi:hypothetical protein